MEAAGDTSDFFVIAYPPPPGVKPNFVNPESRAYQARITIAVCSTIMVLFVGLRVYAQLVVTRMWAADDYMCIAAAITTLAYGGLILAALGPTLGPHIWNIPITYATSKTVRLPVVGSCIFAVCSTCARLALLLLYLRVFGRGNARATRYVLYAGMAVTVVFNIVYAALLLALVMQRPGENALVAASRTAASVRPAGALYMAQAIFSAASDAYVLAVPVRLVWGLKQPWRKRLRVSAVFMTGMLACGCAAARIVYRVQLMRSADASWLAIPYYCVSVAEVNIGIICSCVPANWGAYKQIRTKLRQQLSSLTSSSTSRPSSPSLALPSFAVLAPFVSCFGHRRKERGPPPPKRQEGAAVLPTTARPAFSSRKSDGAQRQTGFLGLFNSQRRHHGRGRRQQQQQQHHPETAQPRLPTATVGDHRTSQPTRGQRHAAATSPAPERHPTHQRFSAAEVALAAASPAAASTTHTWHSTEQAPPSRAPATATTSTTTTTTTSTTTTAALTTTTTATCVSPTSPTKSPAHTMTAASSRPPTPALPRPSDGADVDIAGGQPPSSPTSSSSGFIGYALTSATSAAEVTASLDLAHILLPLPAVLRPPRASSASATSTPRSPLAELMEFIMRYDRGAATAEAATAATAANNRGFGSYSSGSNRASTIIEYSSSGDNDGDDDTLRDC